MKDDPNRPETEEDGKQFGALRMARWKHQNKQLREQGKKGSPSKR
ncbi:hypothetical protein [Halomonas aquatica]|uniref:Transposase n=1 Tax=Halomonas aquatica TaxID=3151123 RepID=A0ABV1NG29_9GAMM